MANADYTCPTCDACADLDMPVFSFDDCKPEQRESEINQIFLTVEDPDNAGEALGGPTDWTESADWATALDNTTDDKVRQLTGIGDLPEPEQETRIVSNRRRIVGKKTFTLNFTIDDTNDTNYEAMRNLECGVRVRFWYGDIGSPNGSRLYGGQEGILATAVKANMPKDRGENTYDRFEIAFEWESFCHPERVANPVAA